MEKYILALVCAAFLLNCSPSKKSIDAKEDALFNAWLHHSKQELVQRWGQPDSTRPDGRKGEVLIYKEGIDAKSVMNGRYTGVQYSFRKEIYVNADSLIYNWKAWRRK